MKFASPSTLCQGVRNVFALALLVVAVSACATQGVEPYMGVGAPASTRIDAALKAAELSLAAERCQDALAQYARILEIDPENQTARLGLGETYLASGSPDDALAYFEPLSTSTDATMRVRAIQGLGVVALVKGETDAALTHFRAAVSQDDAAWRAWNGLGRIYDKQRQWAQADDAYRHALRHASTDHVIFNNWGMSYLSRNQAVQAAEKFTEALKREPDFSVAETNLRFALALQGKYQEALVGVDDTDMPSALNNVGYAAILRGDQRNAERYLAQAMEGAPTFHETAWKNLKTIKEDQ